MAKRRGIVGEFLLFLLHHKAYWLIPIIVIFLLLAMMTAFISAWPALAPLMYH